MNLLPGKVAPTGVKGILHRISEYARNNPGKVTGAAVGAAAGAGTLAAIPSARREARKLEGEMLENYTGSPTAKFAELEEFGQRKRFLGEKTAMCKVSNYGGFYPAMEGGFAGGIGSGVAQAGIKALGKLVRGTARSVKERLVLDKQREMLVDHIIKNDPIISVQERVNPGSTIQSYATMTRFAPSLSLDPNVVTSFLRETAQSAGGINPLTVQQLANTEAAIMKARSSNDD